MRPRRETVLLLKDVEVCADETVTLGGEGMKETEIKNRFAFYPSVANIGSNLDRARIIQNCHDAFTKLALQVNEACDDGREKSLAMTHMEDSLAWTLRAIIRQGDKPAVDEQ